MFYLEAANTNAIDAKFILKVLVYCRPVFPCYTSDNQQLFLDEAVTDLYKNHKAAIRPSFCQEELF